MYPSIALQYTADHIGSGLQNYFNTSLNAHPGWRTPGNTSAGQAMALRFAAGTPQAALRNPTWIQASYQALGRWSAFRGRQMTQATYQAALKAAVAQLQGTICVKPATTILDYKALLKSGCLFQAYVAFAAHVPGGAPWVATSKSLYFLVPDLAVPMDANTFEVLSYSVGLRRRPDLNSQAFSDFYLFFGGIAASAEAKIPGVLSQLAQQVPSGAPRFGVGRVIDFGVVGLADAISGMAVNPIQFAATEIRSALPPQTSQVVRGQRLLKQSSVCCLVRYGRRRGVVVAVQQWGLTNGKVETYLQLAKPGHWVAPGQVTFLVSL